MATNLNAVHIGQGDIFIGGTPPAAGVDPNDPTTSAANAMQTGYAAPVSAGIASGFTATPSTITYRPTFYMVITEQAFSEVLVVPTAEEASIATSLQELTYTNLKAAFGQATSLVAAGPPAYNAVFAGGLPRVQTQLLVVSSKKRLAAGGYFITTAYSTYSFDGSTLPFARREETKLPMTLRMLADTTRPTGDQLFQIVEYMADPA